MMFILTFKLLSRLSAGKKTNYTLASLDMIPYRVNNGSDWLIPKIVFLYDLVFLLDMSSNEILLPF